MKNELTILNRLKEVIQTQLEQLSGGRTAFYCRQENLTKKVYGYFNAMYALPRKNISLDGYVDFCETDSVDFYPAVEGNRNIQAVEASVSIRYTTRTVQQHIKAHLNS